MSDLRLAVVIPCYNEEASIAAVVEGFRKSLPTAQIYVFDNASSDKTSERARDAGAIVRVEGRKGKGNAVRRMFADVEADIYVMVDGDATYDAAVAPFMVEKLLSEQLDMVVGTRVTAEGDQTAYRPGHVLGNALFTRSVRFLFGGEFTDVFSGYRVMSRRFVKSLPVFSSGFEIETELSAHAERVRAASAEVPTEYVSRTGDSESKLRTYRDGARIAGMMLRLFEETKPLHFFSICFAILTVVALALGVPVVDEFAHTGLVARFPTAILAVSIQIVAFLMLAAGIILRSVGKARDEARRLRYLAIGAPRPDDAGRHGTPPAPAGF